MKKFKTLYYLGLSTIMISMCFIILFIFLLVSTITNKNNIQVVKTPIKTEQILNKPKLDTLKVIKPLLLNKPIIKPIKKDSIVKDIIIKNDTTK